MPSLEERENLIKSSSPPLSGFTPRPVQRLATRRKPRTMLNVECNHFLRCSSGNSDGSSSMLGGDFNGAGGRGRGTAGGMGALGGSTVGYKMWLEAGRVQPAQPDRPDPDYDSKMWRNFRKQCGFYTDKDGRQINDMIASLYPMNIPAPSKVGECTYRKFLKETPVIQTAKFKRLALSRVEREEEEFRKMKLLSDMRYPPLHSTGEIVPPENYKKYLHYETPAQPTTEEPPGEPTRVDMFGREVPKSKRTPYQWKLSYKSNHPDYPKVQEGATKGKPTVADQPSSLATTRL